MSYKEIDPADEKHYFNTAYLRICNNTRFPKRFECIVANASQYSVKTLQFATFLAGELNIPLHFYTVDPDKNISFFYEVKVKSAIIVNYLYDETIFKQVSDLLRSKNPTTFLIAACCITTQKTNAQYLKFYTVYGCYIDSQRYYAINIKSNNITGSYNSITTGRVNHNKLTDINFKSKLDSFVTYLLTNGVFLDFNYNEIAIQLKDEKEGNIDFLINKYSNKKVSVYLFNNNDYKYFLAEFSFFLSTQILLPLSEKLFKYFVSTPTPMFIVNNGVLYVGSSADLELKDQNPDNSTVQVDYSKFIILYNENAEENTITNLRELLQSIKDRVYNPTTAS